MLSACGVAALLRNAPWMYQGVRIAGALYLAYVALKILRSPAFVPIENTRSPKGGRPLRTAFVKGLLTNLLNPKALLFCSVLLPQFLQPAQGHLVAQVVELGAILVVMGMVFDTACVLGASRLASWLRRNPVAQAIQRWAFCAALLAFAVCLSLD